MKKHEAGNHESAPEIWSAFVLDNFEAVAAFINVVGAHRGPMRLSWMDREQRHAVLRLKPGGAGRGVGDS